MDFVNPGGKVYALALQIAHIARGGVVYILL